MPKPEDTIGASCPSGGDFYVCEQSGFIGCCTTNACQTSDARCPTKNLEPMSFDAAEYAKIPAQECFGSESGVEWYVCTGTKGFAFMGCCAVNACSSGGCAEDDLRTSKMSSDEKNAQIFLGGEAETTTKGGSETSSATRTSVETSASTTGSGSSETTTSESSGSNDGGLSQGAIIGIAVGASIAGIAIIAALLFLFWRRMKRSRQQQADASKGPLMGFTGGTPGTHESSQFQDMKYQSQYSPNTASFVGMQSPHSTTFTHPNSPQPYHDRASFHPGMSPSPGVSSAGFHSPAPSQQQWSASPEQQQHGFLAAGGAYSNQQSPGYSNTSPPAHMTNFNMSQPQTGFGPAELPASMTQQSSELSNMSELPANPNTVSVQSYSGVPGRESELSGVGKDDAQGNRI
ncbi:podoplanin domain-containing protein [Sarocladium implicatum]|nr:podoplanin domain-containing protein [Sarocladium implicatum]